MLGLFIILVNIHRQDFSRKSWIYSRPGQTLELLSELIYSAHLVLDIEWWELTLEHLVACQEPGFQGHWLFLSFISVLKLYRFLHPAFGIGGMFFKKIFWSRCDQIIGSIDTLLQGVCRGEDFWVWSAHWWRRHVHLGLLWQVYDLHHGSEGCC